VSSCFFASSSGPWFQAKKEEKESLAEAARLSKEAGSQGHASHGVFPMNGGTPSGTPKWMVYNGHSN